MGVVNLANREEIAFRNEIAFKGTIEEFNRALAELDKRELEIGRIFKKPHLAGCWPVSPMKVLGREAISRMLEGQKRIKLVKPIPGGLLVPHFHWENEIVLMNRQKFKELVTSVAGEIAGLKAMKGDYAQTLEALHKLYAGGVIVDY
ncbi:MAG: hypothetical protein ACFFCH_10275 [Promethearchaeota archaeon]